jgi:hypothetical protein
MTDRKGQQQGEVWIVPNVAPRTQEAAEQAAATSGLPLEIWLAETVLRACQEGVGNESVQADLQPKPIPESYVKSVS